MTKKPSLKAIQTQLRQKKNKTKGNGGERRGDGAQRSENKQHLKQPQHQSFSTPQQQSQQGTSNRKSRTPPQFYNENDYVLLVGEGNLSFSRALCERYPGIKVIATTYDTEQNLYEKYPDAKEIVEVLGDYETVSVHHKIDATALHKYRSLRQPLTKITFNFPHVGQGIKDLIRNVRANQALLSDFFSAAKQLADKVGITDTLEVLVTVKEGAPYDEWDVKSLAKAQGFFSKTSARFVAAEWEGYTHRRTLGYVEGVSTEGNEEIEKARTHVFVLKKPVHGQQTTKRKRREESDDEEADD
ncbi:hypothetical protein BJ742DRAFT_869374 [Cladochytrium replicatum]|nr:hypothetical protein BJ742DRAFT_869374 [Cladochytrium replicatum]